MSFLRYFGRTISSPEHMEQTPLPPLVSDEQIAYMRMGALKADEYGDKRTRQDLIMDSAEGGCRFAMAIYEQARKSDREVIQALCDTLAYVTSRNFGDEHARILFYANGGKSPEKALALAKSQCGIEPKTEHP